MCKFNININLISRFDCISAVIQLHMNSMNYNLFIANNSIRK